MVCWLIAAALVRPRGARGSRPAVIALLVTGAIALGVGHVWALPARMLSGFGKRLPRVLRLPGAVRPGAHRGCTACCWSRCSPHARLRAGGRRPPAGPGRRWRSSSASAGRGRCCSRATTSCRGALLLVAVLGTAVLLRPRPRARRRRLALSGHARRARGARRHERRRPSPSAPSSTGSTGTIVHEARQAGRRLASSGTRRYGGLTFPRQADDRHARQGRAEGALLARVGAEHRRARDVDRGGRAGARRPAGAARPGRAAFRRASCGDGGWEKQHVTIEALRDKHLPGGSVPVQFAPGASVGSVSYDPTGIAIATTRCRAGRRLRRLELRTEPDAAPARRLEADLLRFDRRPAATSIARWSLASTRGCSAGRIERPTCIT